VTDQDGPIPAGNLGDITIFVVLMLRETVRSNHVLGCDEIGRNAAVAVQPWAGVASEGRLPRMGFVNHGTRQKRLLIGTQVELVSSTQLRCC